MTRKSKRELERSINDLCSTDEHGIQAWMWADLKDYYGGRLSPSEARLLDDPEAHLSLRAPNHTESEER